MIRTETRPRLSGTLPTRTFLEVQGSIPHTPSGPPETPCLGPTSLRHQSSSPHLRLLPHVPPGRRPPLPDYRYPFPPYRPPTRPLDLGIPFPVGTPTPKECQPHAPRTRPQVSTKSTPKVPIFTSGHPCRLLLLDFSRDDTLSSRLRQCLEGRDTSGRSRGDQTRSRPGPYRLPRGRPSLDRSSSPFSEPGDHVVYPSYHGRRHQCPLLFTLGFPSVVKVFTGPCTLYGTFSCRAGVLSRQRRRVCLR